MASLLLCTVMQFAVADAARPNVTLTYFDLPGVDDVMYQRALHVAAAEINANETLLPNNTLDFRVIEWSGSDDCVRKYLYELQRTDVINVGYLGTAYAGVTERLAVLTKVFKVTEVPPTQHQPGLPAIRAASLPRMSSVPLQNRGCCHMWHHRHKLLVITSLLAAPHLALCIAF